jgi:hypothetical protein
MPWRTANVVHSSARERCWLAFVGTVLVTGCEDGRGGGGGAADAGSRDAQGATPDDLPIEEETPPEQFFEELCRRAHPCCEAAGTTGSAQDCVAALTMLLDTTLAFDAHRASTCLRRLRAASYGSEGCPIGKIDETCRAVLHPRAGSGAEGAPCKDSLDCAGGPEYAACAWDSAEAFVAGRTTCVPMGRASEGDACGGTLGTFGKAYALKPNPDPAPARAYCDETDGLECDSYRLTCRHTVVSPSAEHALGDACYGFDCEAGTFCDFSSFHCKEVVSPGQPCIGDSPYGECASGGNCWQGRCEFRFGGLRLNAICGEACDPSVEWSSPTMARNDGALPGCSD